MNTISKITIPAMNILRRMRVQELKDLATKKGLDTEGTKNILIEKLRKKADKTDQKTAYQQEYRKEDENRVNENRLKVLNRIAEGKKVWKRSLDEYNITQTDINNIRAENGLEPLGFHAPYYEPITPDVREEERYLPDNSEIIDAFVASQNEVQGVRRTLAPEERERFGDEQQTFSYDVREINKYMQRNPGFASGKSNKPLSLESIKVQYGNPNSEEGRSGTTGRLYIFVKSLGDEYVENMAKVLEPGFLDVLQRRIDNPRVFTRKSGVQGTEASLKNVIVQLEVFLKVLRQYPGFNALETQRFSRIYDKINQAYLQVVARDKAEQLANPKVGKPAPKWSTLVTAIKKYFPDELSKENLLISMYDEQMGRDDYANLFVDDKENARLPLTDIDVSNVRKNTIFIRENRAKAIMVLRDYKTSGIYGTRVFEFSEALTKRIKEYVKTKVFREKLLFGKAKLSPFVAKMLDAIGLTADKRDGNINTLRKSYVTTTFAEMEGNLSATKRVKLQYHMRHGVGVSEKYLRELINDTTFDEIINNQSTETLTEIANLSDKI